MEEIWKDIPGYEGLYQASNLGRIRSLAHVVEYVKHYDDRDVVSKHHFKGKILSQNKSSGYLSCIFSVDGKAVYPLVHRLVASAFIPNPDNKPEVDHIDGDTTNNCVENLRWVTSKENTANSISKGEHTSQNPYKKKAIRDVDTGEVFESMLDAEKRYKIPRGRISGAIKSGQCVYGHKFEIVEKHPKRLFNLDTKH